MWHVLLCACAWSYLKLVSLDPIHLCVRCLQRLASQSSTQAQQSISNGILELVYKICEKFGSCADFSAALDGLLALDGGSQSSSVSGTEVVCGNMDISRSGQNVTECFGRRVEQVRLGSLRVVVCMWHLVLHLVLLRV